MGYPQIIHFNGIIQIIDYKPSFLGTPMTMETPSLVMSDAIQLGNVQPCWARAGPLCAADAEGRE